MATTCYSQDEVKERHVQVAIRMIGHEVLLSLGDSSSLALPVEKANDRYLLQFEKELQIIPQLLVATIDRVIQQTAIASSYLVEVEECTSNKVVYAYEMGDAIQHDLVPCIHRVLPQACYRIYLTLLESKNTLSAFNTLPLTAVKDSDERPKRASYWIPVLITIALLVFLGLFLFYKQKKKRNKLGPNVFSLGAYQFNSNSMELSFQNELVALSSKEAELLTLLLQAANSTVEREYLLKKVWGDEGNYIGRTLDVFISKLRKKLECDDQVRIINVRGVGYKLVIKS